MRSVNKISVILCFVLVFCLVNVIKIDVKAESANTKIVLKKVCISKSTAYVGDTIKFTVEAASSKTKLADEASAVYLMKKGSSYTEKNIALKLSQGKYSSDIRISSEADEGYWKISYVIISDKEGNTQIFYNCDIHGIGGNLKNGNFKVLDDTKAPVLTSVKVDKKKIVNSGKVTISVYAKDEGNLAKEAHISYILKNDKGGVEKNLTLTLQNGVYKGELVIDSGFQPGLYQINFITLQDVYGNVQITYNSKVHKDLGKDLSDGNITVNIKK